GDFGRHRIGKRQLHDTGFKMRRRDGARVAAVAGLSEMRHHVGARQRAYGLERHQLGIARPDADRDELAAAHMPARASALTAAAAMALPPSLPRTTRNGTPCGFSIRASLASAAPTKPTGMPRTAAGLGAPASISSNKRNSAVGALPIATTAPARFSPHRSIAAAVRVVPRLWAS